VSEIIALPITTASKPELGLLVMSWQQQLSTIIMEWHSTKTMGCIKKVNHHSE